MFLWASRVQSWGSHGPRVCTLGPSLGRCFLATNPVSTAEAATSRPQSGGRCTLARACSGGWVAASLQGSFRASLPLAPAAEQSCLHSLLWLQPNYNTGRVILSEDPGPV